MNDAIKKTALTYGLIGALLFIALRVFIWIVDLQIYSSFLLGFGMLLATYIIGVIAQIKARSANGGYITFVQAVIAFIITISCIIIGDFIINYLVFNIIDPEAQVVLKEIGIDGARKSMEMFGTPENIMETELAKMEDAPSNYSPGKMITGAAFVFIGYTLFGLISAAIIKKNAPQSY